MSHSRFVKNKRNSHSTWTEGEKKTRYTQHSPAARAVCTVFFLAFRPRAVFVLFVFYSTANDSITAPLGAVTSLDHVITVVLFIVFMLESYF